MGVDTATFMVIAGHRAGSPGPADLSPVARRVAGFVASLTPALQAKAVIAMCSRVCQAAWHKALTHGGRKIAQTVAGRPGKEYLILALAGLTSASVANALFGGGKA